MIGEPSEQLYQYWLSKHVDDRVPSRAGIDPVVDVPHLAANLMIIDVTPDGYKYRLVGSAIVERVGLDMTGKPYGTSGAEPTAIREFKSALDLVVAEKKPYRLIARIDLDAIATNVLIVLPLTTAGGEVEKILIGSFYNQHFKFGTRVSGLTTQEIAWR